MNENTKTLAFVAAAAAILLAAWAARPKTFETTPEEQIGKPLFTNFSDPLAANSMEIVTYDDKTATMGRFKVAQIDGLWSIPSHDNYPADAKDQLAQAAGSLVDLKVLGIVSDNPGDHELYGVIEPDKDKVSAASQGVGMFVIMQDKAGKDLARLIVGKPVKNQDQRGMPGGDSTHRYVRRAGNDQVYEVELRTDKLTTKFDNWIEKDLLKLKAFDIEQIVLKDYSVEAGMTKDGRMGVSQPDERSEVVLDYDNNKAEWSLASAKEFQKGKPIVVKLKEGEELNTAKLNDLKTALGDLKIVDVERKPAGLEGDLEAFLKKTEGGMSLVQRGFYPVGGKNGGVDILSSDGEVIVKLSDGVEYLLRFGQIGGMTKDAGDPVDKKEDDQKEESSASNLSRYIFVMAQFDPNLIPKPQLEALPEAKPADAETADAEKPVEGAEKKEGEEASKPEEGADDAERKQIEQDNRRKEDEYNQKVEAGKKRVAELNHRFSDWYYLVSDSEYRKIHLGLADIIKAKAKEPGQGDTMQDFQELQKKLKPR